MSKAFKFCLMLTFFFILVCGVSFATNENTDIDNSQATSLNENEDLSSTTTNSSTNIPNSSGVTSVTQVSNYSEANLGLNNVLNIILIAIGILIILFAIAILIRLKQ